MVKKCLIATGIFKGLKVPAECRGKYVLVVGRKVVDCAASPKKMLQNVDDLSETPLIIGVPESNEAIAAF